MGKAWFYGLIGYPVAHSLSAVMQQAAFKALNINATYRLFEIKPEHLQDFLLRDVLFKDTKGHPFRAQTICGFNITIPHKVRALEIVRAVEKISLKTHPDVVLTGAVNTVRREDGRLKVRNTDIEGFVRSLGEDLVFKTKDQKVLLFGCGGAGRAVIAGLTQEAAKVKKVYVYDASLAAMQVAQKHFANFPAVAKKLEFIESSAIPQTLKESQLLVNATSVGMKEGDGSPIDKKFLHPGLSVYDLVYNRRTQLLKDASFTGIPCCGGLGMLLYQGAAALRLWTGEDAPVARMRKALEEAIKK